MGFFTTQWAVVIVGFLAHLTLDRSPIRRTAGRTYELAALWLIVGMGAFNLWAGFGHTGPTSAEVAASIGYAPSMFQWEIGWADIALGVLGVLCVRAVNRGRWTDATLVALTVSFFGDGIGHIMQLVAHGNVAPNNVWAIPTCFLVPSLSILFVALARRHGTYTPGAAVATPTAPARSPA
ncbi:DUF6790 family protein [Pseudonocardia sp.]|uniref:DUF6790 family protein n=1 Tax=Pseudonocardia sp. TaxID=60912 RepID=UPI003D0BB82F